MQSVVRKLEDGIEPLADKIMTIILQLIQSAGKSSTVLEDGLLVVGTMASGKLLLDGSSVVSHISCSFGTKVFALYLSCFTAHMARFAST